MSRCIFCKLDSSSSKSIEHIIPESLGNTDNMLPAGIVCDKCNNYFAREIERPLLESEYLTQLRFKKCIQSKKGNIPVIRGIHLQSNKIISLSNTSDGIALNAFNSKDEMDLIHQFLNNTKGTLIFPVAVKPSEYLISRFLGKVAFEALAQRVLETPNGIDEIINNAGLDALRTFVRFGNIKKEAWKFHERTIYLENAKFYEDNFGYFEVLHEYTFLYTDSQELYFILALFGIEYAINMGGQELDGYTKWLVENKFGSPLYDNKNY